MRIVGVDVGGTFTDFHVLDMTTGATEVFRFLDTDNPADAIIDGLREMMRMGKATPQKFGASVMALPSLPTRSSSARAAQSRWSPPRAFGTCSKSGGRRARTCMISILTSQDRWLTVNSASLRQNASTQKESLYANCHIPTSSKSSIASNRPASSSALSACCSPSLIRSTNEGWERGGGGYRKGRN